MNCTVQASLKILGYGILNLKTSTDIHCCLFSFQCTHDMRTLLGYMDKSPNICYMHIPFTRRYRKRGSANTPRFLLQRINYFRGSLHKFNQDPSASDRRLLIALGMNEGNVMSRRSLSNAAGCKPNSCYIITCGKPGVSNSIIINVDSTTYLQHAKYVRSKPQIHVRTYPFLPSM